MNSPSDIETIDSDVDALEPRFREPAGWAFGELPAPTDGAVLRYGYIEPAGGADKVCVLLPGYGEFLEKYYEAIRDLNARGIAVYALDWRGQGGSERLLDDPQKAHATDLSTQIADLDAFLTQIVEPARGARPLFAQAHSFGGHCLMRFLQDHSGRFDYALMTAPMFDIGLPRWQWWAARALAATATVLGFGARYVPGAGPWTPSERRGTGDSIHSSDPARDALETHWYRWNPRLRIGGQTFGWLDAAFRSIRLINKPERLRAVDTPVMIAMPENEALVSKAAIRRAAKIMPDAELWPLPGARHELWHEADRFRKPWLAQVDDFVARQTESLQNPCISPAKRLNKKFTKSPNRNPSAASEIRIDDRAADSTANDERNMALARPKISSRPDYELIVHVDCGPFFPFGPKRLPSDGTSKGHSFITLVDRQARHRITKGFHALNRIYPQKYPDQPFPEEILAEPANLTRAHPGGVVDEKMRYANVSRRFVLTKEQYDKVYDRIGDWDIDRPDYILARRNCNHFTYDVAKAAGLNLSNFLFSNPLPHSLAVDLLLQNAYDRARSRISGARSAIRELFGGMDEGADLTDTPKTAAPRHRHDQFTP